MSSLEPATGHHWWGRDVIQSRTILIEQFWKESEDKYRNIVLDYRLINDNTFYDFKKYNTISRLAGLSTVNSKAQILKEAVKSVKEAKRHRCPKILPKPKGYQGKILALRS